VLAPTYPLTNRHAARVAAGDVVNQPADASFVLTSVLALAGGIPSPASWTAAAWRRRATLRAP
jgi:hypothetical protein